jgi:hypothetical protein
MKHHLFMGVLGHRDSGKSTTWNDLFESPVKTGKNLRQLYLNESEYVDVFLISGSPEEREIDVADILKEQKPSIVLCSVQYRPDVVETFDFFKENEYDLFVQWLNPGYEDEAETIGFDYLGLTNWLLASGATLSMRNGKAKTDTRVQEIIDFIYGWAESRGLINR